MSSTRFASLVVCLSFAALVAGCSGGGDPSSEPETEEAVAAEDSAEEAEAESSEEEEGTSSDIPGDKPVVELQTSAGSMMIELYPEKAPKTVENFLAYVRDGFYDGTIFHRVVPGFVIQGGGFTPDMTKKETAPPIENEANNGLLNLRGAICMARTNDPHSATSQFFINTKDNPALDFREQSLRGWGYAVFGKVIEGMDVVDEIEGVATTSRDGYQDVPVDPIVIERARVIS